MVKNNIEEFFVKSSDVRPLSLQGNSVSNWMTRDFTMKLAFLGKLLLMKSYLPGYWYSDQAHVSNINIFRNFNQNEYHSGFTYY